MPILNVKISGIASAAYSSDVDQSVQQRDQRVQLY